MKEDREFVTSLARGLSVIHAFDRDNAELTLTEIANRTRLSPATARRFLWTLQKLGYVGRQRPHLLSAAESRFAGIGFPCLARVDEIIQPILREIVEHAGGARHSP